MFTRMACLYTLAGFQLACEDFLLTCFNALVQAHHCDRIRKSLIRLDLFTWFSDKETHLESHKVLPPSYTLSCSLSVFCLQQSFISPVITHRVLNGHHLLLFTFSASSLLLSLFSNLFKDFSQGFLHLDVCPLVLKQISYPDLWPLSVSVSPSFSIYLISSKTDRVGGDTQSTLSFLLYPSFSFMALLSCLVSTLLTSYACCTNEVQRNGEK